MPESLCLGVHQGEGGWYTDVEGFADYGPISNRNDAYRAALELVLSTPSKYPAPAVYPPLLPPTTSDATRNRTFIRYFEKSTTQSLQQRKENHAENPETSSRT
jgi:hypothetical protein